MQTHTEKDIQKKHNQYPAGNQAALRDFNQYSWPVNQLQSNSGTIQRVPGFRTGREQPSQEEKKWNAFKSRLTETAASVTGKGSPDLLNAIKKAVSKDAVLVKIMKYVYSVPGNSGDSKSDQIQAIVNLANILNLDDRFIAARQRRVASGLREMMGDIFYWGKQIGACSIKELTLTGSDLHDRGLGVVMVTYQTGWFSTVRKVIKPEERVLERSLFGRQRGSLAKKFNEKRICVNGSDVPLKGQVYILDISTSHDHGTMVEYVKHTQIDEMNRNKRQDTETDEKKKTQIFAALTGLDDLHAENLVYYKGWLRWYPVVIDGDNALSRRIFGKLREAYSTNPGFNLGGTPRIGGVTGISKNFIQKEVKKAFQNMHGRVVPIKTGNLAAFRDKFLTLPANEVFNEAVLKKIIISVAHRNNRYRAYHSADQAYQNLVNQNVGGEMLMAAEQALKDKRKKKQTMAFFDDFLKALELGFIRGENMTAPGLAGVVGPPDRRMSQRERYQACCQAAKDFKMGQLPFYEYYYSNGTIKSHGSVVWQGPNLNQLFDNQQVQKVMNDLRLPAQQ